MQSDKNIHEKAVSNLSAYIVKLKTLIVKNEYDLLLGAGNTGQLMVYIASKVYQQLGFKKTTNTFAANSKI